MIISCSIKFSFWANNNIGSQWLVFELGQLPFTWDLKNVIQGGSNKMYRFFKIKTLTIQRNALIDSFLRICILSSSIHRLLTAIILYNNSSYWQRNTCFKIFEIFSYISGYGDRQPFINIQRSMETRRSKFYLSSNDQ